MASRGRRRIGQLLVQMNRLFRVELYRRLTNEEGLTGVRPAHLHVFANLVGGGKRLTELIANADRPAIVADAVLKAATAVRPRVRYTAGGRAHRLGLLRRFAPAGAVDAGVRKNLRLDAAAVSPHRTSALG